MTPERYSELVDHLWNLYVRSRYIETAERLAAELREAGYTVDGPYDTSVDDYQVELFIEGRNLTETVDVRLELAESLSYEGTTDGVNAMLDVISEGGAIVGQLTPYNYTPEVWVSAREPRAVAERVQIIEDAPGLVSLLEGAYA